MVYETYHELHKRTKLETWLGVCVIYIDMINKQHFLSFVRNQLDCYCWENTIMAQSSVELNFLKVHRKKLKVVELSIAQNFSCKHFPKRWLLSS